jgi:hypothetical protein
MECPITVASIGKFSARIHARFAAIPEDWAESRPLSRDNPAVESSGWNRREKGKPKRV